MIKILIFLLCLLCPIELLAQTISSITYSSDRGASGSASLIAPPNWTIDAIPLLSGLNTITVTVTNSNGQSATDIITITYIPTFPGNAMAGAWAFKDGSGTSATDSSDNIPPNTGTLINGPTWTTQGKFDNAITFDGINDYVNVPDSNNLDFTQSFTISAWVKPTSLSGWHTIAAKGQTANAADFPLQYLYASNAGGAGCGVGQIQGGFIANGVQGPRQDICSTGSPLPIGQLSHVALTYDGSNLKLYINGALNNTVSATGYMEPSTLAWKIGNDDYSDAFVGDIDSVRLYNFALPIGALTPGAECTAADRLAQDNVATATVRGAMNCSIIATTPPLTVKFPAAAAGLKVGSSKTGGKFGQVPE